MTWHNRGNGISSYFPGSTHTQVERLYKAEVTMVILHILPTTDRVMGGIAPLSILGEVLCVNLDIVQWTEAWSVTSV